MILFALLGCKKQIADPGLEKARAWLLTKEGRAFMANHVATTMDFSIEQLEPLETWKIERSKKGSPSVVFSTRKRNSDYEYKALFPTGTLPFNLK